jgi:hypothetical protein
MFSNVLRHLTATRVAFTACKGQIGKQYQNVAQIYETSDEITMVQLLKTMTDLFHISYFYVPQQLLSNSNRTTWSTVIDDTARQPYVFRKLISDMLSFAVSIKRFG